MAAKYHNIPTSERDIEAFDEYEKVVKPNFLMRLFSHILTIISYTVFVLLLPITYWLCVRKVEKSERIIIFRLGALIGSRGPGRVLVFPWIDRTQTIDVSNSAFSVPPQQLITHDGGIIEIGAEVHYAVTDCVALVREVADHQEMIRSLARTVLIRLTVKRNVHQLTKDKHSCEVDVKTEINGQVRKWGLNIRSVVFSEVKILKVPEKEGGIPPLLATLGQSSEGLSPADFAKYIYSMEKPPVKEEFDLQSVVETTLQDKSTWAACLKKCLENDKFEEETCGRYVFCLTDIEQKILLEVYENTVDTKVLDVEEASDVRVTMASTDLAGILKGSLPPLQAYLTNRISVSGDVRKLMLLERFANKSHKPGQTFQL